jgi:hypothetical protein
MALGNSTLRAHHFSKEQGPCAAKQKIEQLMLEATKVVEFSLDSSNFLSDSTSWWTSRVEEGYILSLVHCWSRGRVARIETSSVCNQFC